MDQSIPHVVQKANGSIVHPPYIITDPDQIRPLAKEIGIFQRPKKSIQLSLPFLSAEDNQALETQIKKHYRACGCEQGRLTGMITFFAFILMLSTGLIAISELGIWNILLLYFGCSFLTMLIGKTFGLWRARKALHQLADQLHQQHLSNT